MMMLVDVHADYGGDHNGNDNDKDKIANNKSNRYKKNIYKMFVRRKESYSMTDFS